MQEILKLESDLTHMFDSDERVAMAILEHIRNNKKEMLEKEREVMQDFATEYERQCRINLLRNIERCWEETFKTKERLNGAYSHQ